MMLFVRLFDGERTENSLNNKITKSCNNILLHMNRRYNDNNEGITISRMNKPLMLNGVIIMMTFSEFNLSDVIIE